MLDPRIFAQPSTPAPTLAARPAGGRAATTNLAHLPAPIRTTGLRGWIARLRKRLVEERGQTFALFALLSVSMVGMAALVVDVGSVTVERRRLQNAADAAALAAAQFLPATSGAVLDDAEDAAYEIAALNGVDPGDVQITIDSTGVANDTIEVEDSRIVTLNFAGVFGFHSLEKGATARAQVGAVAGGDGVMPFGVEDADLVFGQQYCLKLGTGNCGGQHKGNFHAIDVDDTGNDSANEYQGNIVEGSSKKVKVGDVKNVVSGNMAGPTRKGVGCQGNNGRLTGNTQSFADVIQDHGDGTYTVLDWESPKLVLVPIVDFDGNSTATILGFAAFVLDGCSGNDAVVGTFIDVVWRTGDWGPLANDNHFGARAVRLTG